MEIRERILEIIVSDEIVPLEQEAAVQFFEQPLQEIGIQSLNFFQLLVKLEIELEIEFNDAEISLDRYASLADLCKVVETKVGKM